MDEGKEILEGFNSGYLIEKHRPELAKQLVKAVEGVELPFIAGSVAGSQEYARERTSKVISKLRENISPRKSDPSKDKDRDDKDRGFEIDI